MQDPNFGFEGTDRITGFKGVITGRTDYISGCSQYLLVPPVDIYGKKREGEWFDIQRVEIANGKRAKKIVLANDDTPGADKTPKPRR